MSTEPAYSISSFLFPSCPLHPRQSSHRCHPPLLWPSPLCFCGAGALGFCAPARRWTLPQWPSGATGNTPMFGAIFPGGKADCVLSILKFWVTRCYQQIISRCYQQILMLQLRCLSNIGVDVYQTSGLERCYQQI